MRNASFSVLAAALLSPAAFAQSNLIAALQGHAVKGFTRKNLAGTKAVWLDPAGGARLTLTLLGGKTVDGIETQVRASNAKLSGDQLLFRCESSPSATAWTNYRSDHGTTFPTYHYWRRQGDVLLVQTVTFPAAPHRDRAQRAFVTMRKSATELFRKLAK